MRVGTKSLLFGAHQIVLHPALVALAWRRIYGEWPSAREAVVIAVHDWGYFGCKEMDGEDGKYHPALGEKIAAGLFGKKMADLAAGHSRSYAKIKDKPLSALCAPDKLASTLVPKKLYLLMTTLTCEVFDYIEDAKPRGKGLSADKDHMECVKSRYRINPELWYDDVVGLFGVMFSQALSCAATPNNIVAEPLEPGRRHPRSWVSLICDKLMTS